MIDYLSQESFKYQQVDFNSVPELIETNGGLESREKKLNHHSSSMLWEMIVSNVTYMKIEYIRFKCAKWRV
ncbi:hypothetical protein LDENG_00154820 [Lucifuga dentata]|nr:hypothetical protein LDENG_00154820 [Lucifuga dentata]